MKLQNKKGFTLIELLVVITIIAILATGAVATYTSQIQKARDSTRISDLKAIESGVQQLYQDKGSYPNAGAATANLPSFIDVKTYLSKIAKDPKSGQKSASTSFDYSYAVAADTNAIVGQSYEVSAALENAGNVTSKATTDNGDSSVRLEQGINTSTIGTQILLGATLPASWVDSTAISATACVPRRTGSGGTAMTRAACLTTESTTTSNATGNSTLVLR